RARQLHAVRPLSHRLYGRARARRPGRPGGARGHRLGEHVPRPRPDRAVRRDGHLRHRPRGRRLRARLLLRPEDAPDRRGLDRMSAPAVVDFENDTFAAGIPHQMFRWLRDNDPVRWYDWPHGKGYWAVTRHDDLVAVHKDTATYSSETGATALEDLEQDAIEARKSMLDTDPPRHTRLRALVNRGFTPRAVAAYTDLL